MQRCAHIVTPFGDPTFGSGRRSDHVRSRDLRVWSRNGSLLDTSRQLVLTSEHGVQQAYASREWVKGDMPLYSPSAHYTERYCMRREMQHTTPSCGGVAEVVSLGHLIWVIPSIRSTRRTDRTLEIFRIPGTPRVSGPSRSRWWSPNRVPFGAHLMQLCTTRAR